MQNKPPRVNKRSVNGILLLDKPTGLSSNAALQITKKLYNAKKAGHTGSLDPLASGMLPLCFGEATKFAQLLLEADKYYQVVGKLGITTTTEDVEGEVVEQKSAAYITREEIEKVLSQFRGSIEQMPPMYSAIKHKGQPLYKLARQGIVIEREKRNVSIHEIEIINFHDDLLELTIRCSKGTYIRTLVADIGKALGCGAHVVALRRLEVVPFKESQMVTLDALQKLFTEATATEVKNFCALDALLLPIESILNVLTIVKISENSLYYLRQGHPVLVPNVNAKGLVKLQDKSGRFLGVGEMLDDGRIGPKRLVQD
jgi:tRNA pseudouridine55 synthase